jgi:hypothetical protein
MKKKSLLSALTIAALFLGTVAVTAQTKFYVHPKVGRAVEYNIADVDSISFTPGIEINYSNLKLNEVSGVGNDPDKFYELINIGSTPIPLAGCQIYYNANSSTGGSLPTGDGNLTWTGCPDQTISGGGLLSLIGRNNPCSFTTGLTAARILIITLKDPDGNVIDRCVRAQDTGTYEITDKSFSRIPDGTGPFYFTTPSPNVMNGTSTDGLILVPQQ